MNSQILKASISADGKLTSKQCLASLSPGAQLEITINATLLIGGLNSKTLLGSGQHYLAQSYHLKLRKLLPQPNGNYKLSYTVSD